ncbi:hypothetical protein HUZ36_04485 [Pseudoalteromonas sp. McH1-7]|uniref:hypothetical protein n=1 Tax=Pseudoalteromonas sp. McH1-7 TaxID=2745574 RepID=UPI001590F6D0|nr:hypothetical protein [Pseudoalteromonas sp. McH1-7]NUZ10030.1 hypothetical protein [Pseudoalteromonas sp. McH1-7]
MKQQDRLEAIITGPEYWTLEEICDASKLLYKKKDTPCAMSARWRNVEESSTVIKHKRVREGTKRLYEYRIEVKTAANDTEEE